jgi:hypothetical protein
MKTDKVFPTGLSFMVSHFMIRTVSMTADVALEEMAVSRAGDGDEVLTQTTVGIRAVTKVG